MSSFGVIFQPRLSEVKDIFFSLSEGVEVSDGVSPFQNDSTFLYHSSAIVEESELSVWIILYFVKKFLMYFNFNQLFVE
jgi:hypothetical protein